MTFLYRTYGSGSLITYTGLRVLLIIASSIKATNKKMSLFARFLLYVFFLLADGKGFGSKSGPVQIITDPNPTGPKHTDP